MPFIFRSVGRTKSNSIVALLSCRVNVLLMLVAILAKHLYSTAQACGLFESLAIFGECSAFAAPCIALRDLFLLSFGRRLLSSALSVLSTLTWMRMENSS